MQNVGRNFMKQYLLICSIIVLNLTGYGQSDSSLIFERAKKTLLHPVFNFNKLINSDSLNHQLGGCYEPGNIYYADEGETVKAIFEGKVVSIFELDKQYGLITKFGSYFIIYFGLTKPVAKKGDYIYTQQSLGKLIKIPSEECQLMLMISNPTKNIDPSKWLK